MQKYFNAVFIMVLLACGSLFSMKDTKEDEEYWRCNAELHVAALNNDVKLIKELVEKGAAINCTRSELAKHNIYIKGGVGASQIGGAITDHTACYTPLHGAANFCKPAAVKALLELGADPNGGFKKLPNARSKDSSPIQRACWTYSLSSNEGAKDVISDLIQYGAKVRLSDVGAHIKFAKKQEQMFIAPYTELHGYLKRLRKPNRISK